MTLTEFRANKKLMKEAAELRRSLILKLMLDIIAAEHVMYQKITSIGVVPDDKTLRLGQIEGYNLCLEKFRLMFEDPPKAPKPLKSTFANPNP